MPSTNTPAPTNTPEPTATPTTPPPGKTRDNPIPAGTPVEIDDIIVTITNVVRPANSIVSQGNMFNDKPEAGQEYIQVEVSLVCTRDASSKCLFSQTMFQAVGADGLIHDVVFVAGVPGSLESTEFFGGATLTGKLFYLVPKDDKTVVLFHDPMLFGDSVYLGLP